MRNYLLIGVAAAALLAPAAAFAQSTGSTDFEGDIVVTGSRDAKGIAGIQSPDTTKAKGVLTQEFIAKQTPGNSILDTINSLPGVSFQNNDPFGSAGGTLSIRGFDSSRISLTFDGIPLNDTGNYALYSNQQLDPELIEQVNVNYGSTDVDSPSAAASGSTVNYRSITPTDDFGVRLEGSAGEYSFFRIFGLINTGTFTPFGTKAWLSASRATNDVVFNNFGKVNKQQYNGKIYQPIGSNGDFISVSGNYNENRNNFFGSAPLRFDTNVYSQVTTGTVGGVVATPQNPILVTGAARTPGTGSSNRFPYNRDELPYNVSRCQVVQGTTNVQDSTNTCGTSFDERYNPSNTGSIRINSRFTLAQGLVLTIDPSFQYTKANGGGTVTGREGTRIISGTTYTGFIGNNYYFGRDLNGDGDVRDTCTVTATGAACSTTASATNVPFGGVTLLAPSQTQTRRYGVIASLRYDLNDNNTVRIGYTFDRGRHRQTGELGYLLPNGFPVDVFPVNNGIRDAAGNVVEKRNRLSYATLNQVSGEYRGDFGNLTINAGLAAKWFQRDLNNYCFTTSASGNVDCLSASQNAAYAAANPYSFNTTTNAVTGYAAPQSRTYKYNRVLPSAGFTYKFDNSASVFFNYSKGIQVPSTDNLYQAFYYPLTAASANPKPETTDNFDAGLRYSSRNLQMQVGPWYTRFTNRLAAAYDVDTQQTFYRNLGRVDKYGIDGSITYRPIPEMTVYVFGNYLKSEIKNNVVLGLCPATLTAANTTNNCTVAGAPIYAMTAGKRESGSPVYMFGGRLQGNFEGVTLGIQAKRTGPRYLNDQNLPNLQCTASLVNQICPTAANTPATYTGTRGFEYQVYGAKAPAYTQVDLDFRVNLAWAGMNDKTYLQFNVQNIFNEYYIGGFSGGSTTAYNVPFVQIGSPRAITGTINFQF